MMSMVRLFTHYFFILAILVSIHATQAKAMDFLIAGAPRPLVSQGNFTKLFALMRQSGITGFFPTFQYQEIPEPKSFGFESDFLPPCSSNDASLRALRDADVKLVVPGELLYPDSSNLPFDNPELDPLKQLIACVGRNSIYAITNYDEAAYHERPLIDVQRFYQHVKTVDASIPVLMVHGPLVMDQPLFSSPSKRKQYLNNVVSFSQYADVVGFDVYPFPDLVAKLATPLSKGEVVSSENAVAEYLQWMSEALPEKRKLMVFQGFAYTDMYEFDFLKETVSIALRNIIRPPDTTEIENMLSVAKKNDVEMIIWWGQGSLRDVSQAPWPDILRFSKEYSN
jgi:hypothetical protein